MKSRSTVSLDEIHNVNLLLWPVIECDPKTVRHECDIPALRSLVKANPKNLCRKQLAINRKRFLSRISAGEGANERVP